MGEFGADPKELSKEGDTAGEIARTEGHDAVATLLETGGASVLDGDAGEGDKKKEAVCPYGAAKATARVTNSARSRALMSWHAI